MCFAGTNTIFTLYIYGISEIRLGGCDRRVLAVTEISFPREGAENQVFYVEKYENYPPEGPPTSAIVDPAGRSSERGQKQGPPFLCKKGGKKLQYLGLSDQFQTFSRSIRERGEEASSLNSQAVVPCTVYYRP